MIWVVAGVIVVAVVSHLTVEKPDSNDEFVHAADWRMLGRVLPERKDCKPS